MHIGDAVGIIEDDNFIAAEADVGRPRAIDDLNERIGLDLLEISWAKGKSATSAVGGRDCVGLVTEGTDELELLGLGARPRRH